MMLTHSEQLIVLFNRGLTDPSNEIQVSAFKTLILFLSNIDNEESMKQFNPILKNILTKAIELIKFDQESGVTAL
jgi:hypothetical protein